MVVDFPAPVYQVVGNFMCAKKRGSNIVHAFHSSTHCVLPALMVWIFVVSALYFTGLMDDFF